MLLDGERRFLALKELGEKTVPAHVLKDSISKDSGKTLMFHIHTSRVQWDPYQQCKALEPLYEKLESRFEGNENNIIKELILLTGTNKRTISARLNFLRWPKQIKGIVYDEKPELYYSVVEIESQIIKPAQKSFPDYFDVVDVDDVRECLFNKYYNGIIHAAIEARKVTPIVKTKAEDKKKYNYALKIFKRIVTKTNYSFENARDDFVSEYPEADETISVSFNRFYNKVNRFYKSISVHDSDILTSLNNTQKQKITLLISDLQELLHEFQEVIDESRE